jgi:diguanylate cyclase (GGDEF)-like protein
MNRRRDFSRFIGRNRQSINGSEPLLLGLMGPPHSTAEISKNDGSSAADWLWQCGCKAYVDAADGDVASWMQCSRHEAMFLAKPRESDLSGAFAPVRAVFTNPRIQWWCAPVLGLSLAAMAKIFFDANVLVRRVEEAESASLVDPLTGLYNRRGWERRVEEERKRLKRDANPVVAVYMLDVDGLKKMNDERGHTAGDGLLRHVSNVIREVTREHDVAARLGGDEFAILTVQSQTAEAERIRARLERGFHAAALSVSIGFAFADSVDAINEAMDRADIAMYKVKKKQTARAARQG